MRGLAFLLCGAILAALLLVPAVAAATQAGPHPAALERQLGDGVEVALSEDTGKVSFIGAERARALEPPASAKGAPPALAARAFLRRYAGSFGLAPASSLRLLATHSAPRGGSAVRLRQEHRGLPVLGGEFVVSLTAAGEVLSVLGEASPVASLDPNPQVGAGAAIRMALAVTARAYGTTVDRLRPGEPALWVHDSRLLGGPGLDRPQLVWRLEMMSADDPSLRELVLVDADRGYVALHFNLVQGALERRVCDAANTAAHVPCTFPVRSEGQPPGAVIDVNDAYDYSGDTYAFYSALGRDSLDGSGMALRSTVRFCEVGEPCPLRNAFWNGEQMVYGQGYASADDVVGHELTHGVTQFESNLLPYYQAGAIGESLSDIFGEFVDLTNGQGDDSAAVRWRLGEDLPGGPVRDLRDPTVLGDPDRMTSPHYIVDPDQSDSGGIHGNSGVGNKTAFLITDGGSFNGRSVGALGIDKAARIYYAVNTTMLTSGSDYADLANALPQACANLLGVAGITASDCSEIADAVAATEMATDPPRAPAPEAPVCGAGEDATTLFFDDMEVEGAWTSGGTAPWSYATDYATSGVRSLFTPDRNVVSDARVISPMISIPASVPGGGVHLRFAHAHGFDDDAEDGGGTYDGGVVEYSLDGGATWLDAGPLISANGYNGTVSQGFSTPSMNSPLTGRAAFVRESHGYISSRLDLGSLSGRTVRFAFRVGTDATIGDFGWAVDDFRVYTCTDTTPPESAITSGPSQGAVVTNRAVSFSFASNEAESRFQCSLDGTAFSTCSSPLTRRLREGRHSFAVRAIDSSGNVEPSPAAVSFRVAANRPRTRITAASIDREDRAAAFRFVASAGLAPLRLQCKLDRRAYSPCASPRTYRNLQKGWHTFAVRAVDSLGRIDRSPARRNFRMAG